jgi:DNA polymerase III epsilon subunit-like protein
MGLFRLVSKLIGGEMAAPAPMPAGTPVQRTVSAGGLTVTATGPASPTVEVNDDEVKERVREHAFVLTADPPPLKTGDEWWNEETHKRRRREGSDKAFAWLRPFAPLEIVKLPQLQAAQEWGPHGASAVAKELRALIREKRKAKEPHHDLLGALYGACLATDMAKSVAFEGTQPHHMVRFVDINELEAVKLDYGAMGYQCIESLTKTDVKWLVEGFGEPAEHQSFDSMWPNIRLNAIARYCWKELHSKNDACKSLGLPRQSMQEWLNELVARNIGYHKEWQERVAARQELLTELKTVLDAAWLATRQPFVVADLETTGLNAETDEVLELAAVRVAPDGTVSSEFVALIKVSQVPSGIALLTGITRELVDREGQPLAVAMTSFAKFVATDPIFFHNAPFDQGFLRKAAVQAKVKLANQLHDTLPLARQVWPSLGTYKLAALAEHVGIPAPNHRALADARVALAVLLAARTKVDTKG